MYFNINFISFLFQIFEHTMSEWLESKIVDKDILTLVNTLYIYFIMKTKMLISPKPKDYKNSNRLYFFSNVRTKTVRTWRQNSKKETLTKVYTLYIYDIMKKKLLNAKLNNLIFINILLFSEQIRRRADFRREKFCMNSLCSITWSQFVFKVKVENFRIIWLFNLVLNKVIDLCWIHFHGYYQWAFLYLCGIYKGNFPFCKIVFIQINV